jgi:hypothetical protein
MPSKVIKCKDCATETADIEEGGTFKVDSCEPLEGEEDKPEEERDCRIVWSIA